MDLGNTLTVPIMSRGDLPICFQQQNIAATASPSYMYVGPSSYHVGMAFNPRWQKSTFTSPLRIVSSSTEWTPLFSGRSAETFKGLPNRTVGMLNDFTAYSSTQPILLELVRTDTLDGSTFALGSSDASSEIDTAASGSSGGTVILSTIVSPGQAEKQSMENIFNFAGEFISRKSVLTDTPEHYTGRCKLLSGSDATQVMLTTNWKVLHY
jgi:hypothetical protein